MNTNSKPENKQQSPSGRRGFMRKIGAAAGIAVVAAAAPAHATKAVNLSDRQRALLKHYDQLGEVAQLTMIDMAAQFASQPGLCRLTLVSGGAA
jgi:hypothetical protein